MFVRMSDPTSPVRVAAAPGGSAALPTRPSAGAQPTPAARVAVALLAAALAVALTVSVAAYIPRALFLIAFAAVTAAAWYGGRWAGVLAAVACVLGIDYWLIPPVGGLTPADPADLVPMAAFLIVAAFVGRVTDTLRLARDAEARTAAALAAANRELAARAAALAEGNEALQAQAAELEAQQVELEQTTQQLQDQQAELELSSQHLQEQQAELEAQAEALAEANANLESALGDAVRARRAADAARQAAEAARARTAAVLESMGDAYFALDGDFRIVAVNAAMVRGSGLARDRLLGRDFWEAFPGALGTAFETHYRAAAAGAARHFTHDYADGRLDLVVDVDAYPAEGGGVAVFWRDVTQRVRAEAAHRDQARLLRTVAENATLALFIMDARQHCVYLNPAAERLTGYTLAELRGGPLHDYVHHTRPDGTPYPLAECPIDRALPQNEREQGTEVFVHKDGAFYPVAFTASPIRDEATGAPVGTIIEVRAVADELAAAAQRERLLVESEAARRAAEEARGTAEAANAAKGLFLANMSHELRTPLNAIGGYVQLLDMGLHGPVTEEQRGALGRVQKAQTRLLSLINDVLNYAKLESGRVEYDVQAVELRDVVADVAPLVEPQMRAKGLAFDVRLPEGPCAVWADREKLGQVLVNLLSNAVKFTGSPDPHTGAPGRVTVDLGARRPTAAGDAAPGARASGPHGLTLAEVAFLRVTDTGVGIPRDKQERIFEPFVQVRAGYAQATEGTGLGLAISRDLARGMGGDLRVRSVEGEGSTFTVKLRRVVTAAGARTDRRLGEERREEERRDEEDRRHGAPREDDGR